MKKKLLSVTLLFAALLCLITLLFFFWQNQAPSSNKRSEQLLVLNEMQQLALSGSYDEMAEKGAVLEHTIRAGAAEESSLVLFLFCGICLLFLVIVFCYIYFAILRPFGKMKIFAEKIAQGNFDLPLNYERSNYFGAFTWAFDSMRREITRARACEREAIDNNKTVIATLSHDIKTPISSIRAYAEGLDAGLDATPEKRARYLNILMRKCDEVSRLTNDLFLHSLSDLDKLKISEETTEICGFLETVAAEIAGEQNDIHFLRPDFTASVSIDRNRFTQIMENLINNARKYAKTEIVISMRQEEGCILLSVRDWGKGILDEDAPFLFDKFYRGKNCGQELGSGLGLYIVKYIVEQMKGSVSLHNHPDGLEVTVRLPEITDS